MWPSRGKELQAPFPRGGSGRDGRALARGLNPLGALASGQSTGSFLALQGLLAASPLRETPGLPAPAPSSPFPTEVALLGEVGSEK